VIVLDVLIGLGEVAENPALSIFDEK